MRRAPKPRILGGVRGWGEAAGANKVVFPPPHTPLGEGVGSLGLESGRNAFGDLHASDFVML